MGSPGLSSWDSGVRIHPSTTQLKNGNGMDCRCRHRGQPYARPDLDAGRTKVTCPVHTMRWIWDGVAFVPDRKYENTGEAHGNVEKGEKGHGSTEGTSSG